MPKIPNEFQADEIASSDICLRDSHSVYLEFVWNLDIGIWDLFGIWDLEFIWDLGFGIWEFKL